MGDIDGACLAYELCLGQEGVDIEEGEGRQADGMERGAWGRWWEEGMELHALEVGKAMGMVEYADYLLKEKGTHNATEVRRAEQM